MSHLEVLRHKDDDCRPVVVSRLILSNTASCLLPLQANVTQSMTALYDEASAFGKAWALQHGVTTAATQQGAASCTAGTASDNTAAPAAAADVNLGPPTLFDMMAQQVTQSWTSVQLVKHIPELLLEEIYAVNGKVSKA